MIQFHGALSETDIFKIISTTTLFTGVDVSEQKMLAEKSKITEYNPEEIVTEQGERGDKLYVIVKGSVAVSVKTATRGWKRINILNPGDVFGEIAILHNVPRTARITTLTSCTFLSISAHDFLSVYQFFPPKARDNIQIIIAKRLQERKYFLH